MRSGWNFLSDEPASKHARPHPLLSLRRRERLMLTQRLFPILYILAISQNSTHNCMQYIRSSDDCPLPFIIISLEKVLFLLNRKQLELPGTTISLNRKMATVMPVSERLKFNYVTLEPSLAGQICEKMLLTGLSEYFGSTL